MLTVPTPCRHLPAAHPVPPTNPQDVTSPMLAHSLANLASALLWLQLRQDRAR